MDATANQAERAEGVFMFTNTLLLGSKKMPPTRKVRGIL
jgi:hypothetical protein